MSACETCGKGPLATREEWRADKLRQEIGYAIAKANSDLQPTYCLTCYRYQGIRITGDTRDRLVAMGFLDVSTGVGRWMGS